MKISPRTAALANLNHWKAGQGARIKANRPAEVYRACEYMAQSFAAIRDPLELTPDELTIAVKRAISQERNKTNPDRPLRSLSLDAWWAQIDAIQRAWGITLTQEDWTQKRREPRKEAA